MYIRGVHVFTLAGSMQNTPVICNIFGSSQCLTHLSSISFSVVSQLELYYVWKLHRGILAH